MQLLNKINRLVKNQQFLFGLFLCMLILPNVFMVYTEPTPLLTRVVNVLLPLGAYWLCMSWFRKPGWAFWALFLFIFFDAFDIVLLHLFGEGPVAVDMFLNVATTNVTEVDELLSNLLLSVVFVFVVYGGGMVLAVISVKNKAELSRLFLGVQRKLAWLILIPALILLGVNYAVDKKFRLLDHIFPVNTCYNLLLSGERYLDGLNYDKTSSGFVYHAVNERPDSLPEVYVLVVGETLRADNMGIYGYERNTTPRLDSLQSELVVFHDAITMSNTTHKSVPLLLTPVASESWDSLYTQRGIITAYKEAGYQTAFYSNQRRNKSFIDALGCEAHESKFVKDDVPVGESVSDEELLKLLDARLAACHDGKLLVVLHCYGSHFNYRDRYPAANARFKPDEIISADKQYRQELVNAYDNTVLFTDNLLARIIEQVKAKNVVSAVMFTSDHGEDIYDDERGRFLHASPMPTYYQLRVPLLVWASDEYRAAYPEKWGALTSHRDLPVSTNLVVFHTMLDMSGINVPQLRGENALSSQQFVAAPRRYVTDHNEYVSITECGLKQQDVAAFSAHHLSYK